MASLEEHCYVLVFANFPGMLFVEEWLRRRTGEGQRVFNPEVLDLTEDDLMDKFAIGVSMVTALSLTISYPTLAATSIHTSSTSPYRSSFLLICP
ncbi:unnamed protein product [Ilex paraguariensis]|uniref:Uncharacterized protein n=1 Tax=Ilex paraguariensis TaxID=185542 RepID=A0ABC8S768_9AQUA